jgi:Spy/CpxP family protein refolding chaperone
MTTRTWKATLLSVALAVCSSAALAQSPDASSQATPPGRFEHGQMRRGMDPERQLHMLTRLLTLSPEQQTGVKALLNEQQSQIQALRNQQPADANENPSSEARAAMRTKFDLVRSETNTKITALLDENQKKTFADWQAQRKAEMQRRGSDAAPPRGGSN